MPERRRNVGEEAIMIFVENRLAILILALLVLASSACAPQAGGPTPGLPVATPAGTETPGAAPETTPTAPPEVAQAARAWLAGQLDLPPEQVAIGESERRLWQDSCLGLGGPAESCAQAVTPGWLLLLEAGGETYEVRTDEQATAIRSPQIAAGTRAPDPLAGTRWTLESFGEPGAETPVLSGSELTLEFEPAGQAGGSGGCNSFGGRYEAAGEALSFAEINSTLMACEEEERMAQELQYLQALITAESFELVGDRLKIWYDGGSRVLNFTQAPQ
jgi:heat shock protein HslJ